MIMVEPCAGLGNRLLSLSSAYAVAKKLKRELVVVWKREAGCNIKAEDLFLLPVKVIEISENGYKKEPISQIKSEMKKKKLRQNANLFLECDDVERIKQEQGYAGLFRTIKQEPVVYIKSFGPVCDMEETNFSFLEPSQNVLKKGEALFEKLDKSSVGVHIRRTDHTDAILNSPLALFCEHMKQLLFYDAETKFFVATDDVSVKEELKVQVPESALIFYESGIIDRNSKAGIEDAFIEMLALSKCKKIYGSYKSTFSLIPSYIGNIPLEIVAKQNAR